MDQEKLQKCNKLLSHARAVIERRYTFMIDSIAALVPYAMSLPPYINGLATTKHGVMMFDPEVVSKWTLDDMVTGYIHEAEHMIRKHGPRRERPARRGSSRGRSAR